jgi:hypothetical protein
MQAGGNAPLAEWMTSHGVQHEPIEIKYKSFAAALYKEKLQAEVDGRSWREPSGAEFDRRLREHQAMLDEYARRSAAYRVNTPQPSVSSTGAARPPQAISASRFVGMGSTPPPPVQCVIVVNDAVVG